MAKVGMVSMACVEQASEVFVVVGFAAEDRVGFVDQERGRVVGADGAVDGGG